MVLLCIQGGGTRTGRVWYANTANTAIMENCLHHNNVILPYFFLKCMRIERNATNVRAIPSDRCFFLVNFTFVHMCFLTHGRRNSHGFTWVVFWSKILILFPATVISFQLHYNGHIYIYTTGKFATVNVLGQSTGEIGRTIEHSNCV